MRETVVWCDVPETKARKAETVTFVLDGIEYEIDLCAVHKRAFGAMTETWRTRARRAHNGKVTPLRRTRSDRGRTASRTRSDRERSAEIREWARGRGIAVSERGRISEDVIRQYAAR